MVEVLSEDEGTPSSWPTTPGDLSTEAAALDPGVIWPRIEAWIAHRWNERQVTWIVAGPGVWSPRLKPATVDTFELWRDGQWESVTLDAAPLGYELEAETYRFIATVGSTDDPPETVLEAYRRLAEYMAQVGADPAAGHTSVTDGDYSFDRPAGWAARALHYSGAADLLRSYRR